MPYIKHDTIYLKESVFYLQIFQNMLWNMEYILPLGKKVELVLWDIKTFSDCSRCVLFSVL